MRGDSLKVDVLAFNRGGVVRIRLGAGAEILDGNEFVIRVESGMGEHGANKCGKVEPFAGWKPAQQSVVEIAAVNICNCFHNRFIKERGSQALRPKTPFRVGRALRLDKNLLRGSVSIVSNFRPPRKGVNPEISFQNKPSRPPTASQPSPARRAHLHALAYNLTQRLRVSEAQRIYEMQASSVAPCLCVSVLKPYPCYPHLHSRAKRGWRATRPNGRARRDAAPYRLHGESDKPNLRSAELCLVI